MELGLGSVAVSPRPYVDEPWLHAGQFWVTGRAAPWLHVSAISAFDDRAMAGGGAAKALYFRSDRFNGGFDVELGFGWGAFGLPFAIRAFGQNWLYSSPRLGNFGIDPAFALPVGANVHLGQGAFMRLEYQSDWVKFDPYGQRHHLGAAMAVQW